MKAVKEGHGNMRKTEGEQSAMVFIGVLRAHFRLWA